MLNKSTVEGLQRRPAWSAKIKKPQLRLELSVAAETFAICRLEGGTADPPWVGSSSFTAVTRTPAETCVVCPEDHVPNGIQHERGWRCLKVAGPLDFSMTGVLASLTSALADAQVSIIAQSTYDYLFVRERDLATSVEALRAAGHTVGPFAKGAAVMPQMP